MSKISFSLRRIAKNWADKPDSAAIFTDAADEIESLAERIAELERQITVGKEDREHLYWKAKELEQCCSQRGARLQIMWEWCDHSKTPNEWYDWFDSDGVPVSKEIDND